MLVVAVLAGKQFLRLGDAIRRAGKLQTFFSGDRDAPVD
jgi:hypothetical protein